MVIRVLCNQKCVLKLVKFSTLRNGSSSYFPENINTMADIAFQNGNEISKGTSITGRIKTRSLSQTSKGKVDKHILTNNKITSDQLN